MATTQVSLVMTPAWQTVMILGTHQTMVVTQHRSQCMVRMAKVDTVPHSRYMVRAGTQLLHPCTDQVLLVVATATQLVVVARR